MKKLIVLHSLKALAYYLIGFFITWLVYKLSGTPYAHRPNLYHLVGLLVLFIGLVLSVLAIASLSKKQGHIGALLIHILVIGGSILRFVFEVNRESTVNVTTKPEDILTINKDTVNKTGSLINGAGDTMFYIKNDSVLIDRINTDSTTNQ
jgi:hypothetical protein